MPPKATSVKCPWTCELTNDAGYVVYSALGSFYIPMFVMLFFYWRIYRAAIRTTRAINQGFRTTKGELMLTVISSDVEREGERAEQQQVKVKTIENERRMLSLSHRQHLTLSHSLSPEPSHPHQYDMMSTNATIV